MKNIALGLAALLVLSPAAHAGLIMHTTKPTVVRQGKSVKPMIRMIKKPRPAKPRVMLANAKVQ